jgi:hypothetical protein
MNGNADHVEKQQKYAADLSVANLAVSLLSLRRAVAIAIDKPATATILSTYGV